MTRREKLQETLIDILGSDNVYFQPPPSILLKYPCIVYHRDFRSMSYADNKPYKHKQRYQVTVIDPNPDSTIHEKVAELPLCSYDRNFTTDNLNHDVYDLFF